MPRIGVAVCRFTTTSSSVRAPLSIALSPSSSMMISDGTAALWTSSPASMCGGAGNSKNSGNPMCSGMVNMTHEFDALREPVNGFMNQFSSPTHFIATIHVALVSSKLDPMMLSLYTKHTDPTVMVLASSRSHAHREVMPRVMTSSGRFVSPSLDTMSRANGTRFRIRRA